MNELIDVTAYGTQFCARVKAHQDREAAKKAMATALQAEIAEQNRVYMAGLAFVIVGDTLG